MNERELISEYLGMVQKFIDEELSAAEFSETFLTEFKNEEPGLSDETFDILQRLFGEADAYCEDQKLRGEWEISEEELRDAAIKAAERLEKRATEMDE